MDTERLHRLAEEADAEHRAAMRTFDEDLAARVFEASPEVRANRRRFVQRLGLGAGAAVLSIPVLARLAAAQTSTTAEVDEGNAGPTPPLTTTEEDRILLGWAQSVELAAVAAYEAAAGTGQISDQVLPVALLFRDHHREHAQAHGGLAGKAAVNRANGSILEAYAPQIEAANNQTELLTIAFELETIAAATYVAALGELQSVDASTLVASIAPIESRHAVVLAEVLGLPLEQQSPVLVDTADALDPRQFPIVAR